MWCLWRSRARSRCSGSIKRTKASPFLLPWAFRHRATPPLKHTFEFQLHTQKIWHRTENTRLSTSMITQWPPISKSKMAAMVSLPTRSLYEHCLLSGIFHFSANIWVFYTFPTLLLGNVEALEESGNVLVRWLPWKSSSSDDCLAVHRFSLTAIRKHRRSLGPCSSGRGEWSLFKRLQDGSSKFYCSLQ